MPRCNTRITSKKVRVIDNNLKMLGILSLEEALKIAQDAKLDLVEISHNTVPPVCKILDFKKHMYHQKRKKNDTKKHHKISLKEIKLRPNIGKHDLDVRIKNIIRFIDRGDKVKVTMMFRGREATHKEIGDTIINKILDELKDKVKLDTGVKKTNNQIIVILTAK